MNLTITKRFIVLALAIIFAFGLSFTPALADHPEHDHSADMHMDDEAEKIEMMESIIALLTQLVAILSEQAGAEVHDHSSHDHDEAEHDHMDDEETLAIWVELHTDETHVHVVEDGEEESFFVDYDISEEEEIIEEISNQTDLSVEEIEAVIEFNTEEDEHHHDAHDHDDEIDLDGIHIMPNGDVMLGNGEVLSDATITDDGMIMLENGDLVEPEFDLR